MNREEMWREIQKLRREAADFMWVNLDEALKRRRSAERLWNRMRRLKPTR